jgi:hypothetical protein
MKYWIPVVRSEASCAITQDTFWWLYLSYFKKEHINLKKDILNFFSRISESFTALFMSIDQSFRDKFFNVINFKFFFFNFKND